MIEVLVKMLLKRYVNTSTYSCEFNKACKFDEHLNTKNCSCIKRLFGKLVFAYEDEILNATQTLLVDKKITCDKNNCLIHTVSLVIICLYLWVVISVSCYYYYTRLWIKKEYVLAYYCKMNSVKESNIKNRS